MTRSLVAGIGTVLAAAVLAACGSGDDEDAAPQTSTSSAAPTPIPVEPESCRSSAPPFLDLIKQAIGADQPGDARARAESLAGEIDQSLGDCSAAVDTPARDALREVIRASLTSEWMGMGSGHSSEADLLLLSARDAVNAVK